MSLLEGKQVCRNFGGVKAIENLDFKVEMGEILGLIGPNGAGKTTLLNLISGILPITRGSIFFEGEKLNNLPAHNIGKKGIARTFQIVKPFDNLSVKENVMVGAIFGGGASIKEAEQKAKDILKLTGLYPKSDFPSETLNLMECKRLEIARALAMSAKLILLDEVMAGLNNKEVEFILELIREINSNGVTFIIIEHVMHAIINVSTHILVLHRGKKLCEGTPNEISCNPEVIDAYLGSKYAERYKSYVQKGDLDAVAN